MAVGGIAQQFANAMKLVEKTKPERDDRRSSRCWRRECGAHPPTFAAFQRRAARLAAGTKDEVPPARHHAEASRLIQAFAARCTACERIPRVIQLRQAGEMRRAPRRAWQRFTARQFIAVRQSGFVWFARMRPAPLVWVDVLDAYEAGEGSLEARLFASLTLARSAGAG